MEVDESMNVSDNDRRVVNKFEYTMKMIERVECNEIEIVQELNPEPMALEASKKTRDKREIAGSKIQK